MRARESSGAQKLAAYENPATGEQEKISVGACFSLWREDVGFASEFADSDTHPTWESFKAGPARIAYDGYGLASVSHAGQVRLPEIKKSSS